jgi:hypothetical protein
MNKESIKNAVSLFLHCQKLVAKPKRLRFSDLKYLLDQVMNETEFNHVLKSIFNLADHYFLLEKYKHPTALLVDINKLADRLKLHMNPNQKLIFLTILTKFMKTSAQQENTSLNQALYCIAEIFSFNQKQTDSLKQLFFSEEPGNEDYQDSILITNSPADYKKVMDGMKVIYNPDFNFCVWVKNVKSVNNLMFKLLSIEGEDPKLEIVPGDVCAYNGAIQKLLDKYNITLHTLSSKLLSHSPSLPSYEVPGTERSPVIKLNGPDCRVEIEGVSMITSPLYHFNPVFYWLDKLEEVAPKKMSIHISLRFFNTYTSKIILKIFQRLADLESTGTQADFHWYYEKDDDEMKEAGEHYASIVNRKFNFISIAPINLISA